MKLHEAIVELLKEKGYSMTTTEIADAHMEISVISKKMEVL